MTPASFSFCGFRLDPADRQLKFDDVAVELSPRYFDALALLVREAGKLVSKDRFLDEVWGGVPVTDEALTQCIKTLRRQLGDQAGAPRFIETVPKHGYRFIAPVSAGGEEREEEKFSLPTIPHAPVIGRWREVGRLGSAGTLGGGAAGLVGGVLYGFVTAPGPASPGVGEASALLVMMFLTIVAGLIGGTGVGFGIAAASFADGRKWLWTVAGGAGGGLIIGALARLVGMDAFNLLLGKAPADLTGGIEGAVLGAAVGLGSWPALRDSAAVVQKCALRAALLGAVAGSLIPLLGGEMMGGSLELLARQFPGSKIRLDQIGALFGESGFGLISQVVTGAIEGALFAGGVVSAMIIARRTPRRPIDLQL